MSEETIEQQAQTAPTRIEVITPGANMFSDNVWSTEPVVVTPPTAGDGGSSTIKTETPVKAADDSEIVDEIEYLERQTGYKSWDDIKALKTEVEELRSKAQTTAEVKFVNEQSQKLFEAWKEGKEDDVYSFLDTKRKLSAAANLPAAEAIKLHLQQTNPHYTADDVQDVFEERYSVPKKPVQGVGEDTEEFNERMTEYNTRVAKVNRAIERDAVAAKQDLAQRITELVPPEIPKREQGNEGPSQEVLEGRRKFIENFIKSVPKELEAVKGFSTTFKDDVVEFPIAYEVTPEEAKVYQAKLEGFANNNLDVNTLFSERWVNKDGSVNIRQVAEDLYLLDNRDKIFKKIATETGMQRMVAQQKLNSNITVNGEKPKAEIKKDENAAMLEHMWKS